EEEEEEEEEQPKYSSGCDSDRYDLSAERGGPSTRHQEEEEEEETIENSTRLNPFAKGRNLSDQAAAKPVSRDGRLNPFKVLGSGKSAAAASGQRNVLDNMWSSRKPTPPSGSAGKANQSLKPLMPKPKTKTQSTLLQMTKAANQKAQQSSAPAADRLNSAESPPPATATEDRENNRLQTGFQLWLEDSRASIEVSGTGVEETDIIREAMRRFRMLSAEERLQWTARAKGQSEDVRKRKRAEEGGRGGAENEDGQEADERNAKKKKSVDPSSKLSAFAFKAN
ncbi:hypothetical protein LDENG_00188390, partial [Lucifuga dentata]